MVFTTALLSAGFTTAMAAAPAAPVTTTAPAVEASATSGVDAELASFDMAAWRGTEIPGLSPVVLKLALSASRCAVSSGAAAGPSTLSIIDYSRPSSEPRLWVLDLATRTVLYHELVSHGQGSGGNLPTKFSNLPDSHQTSLGLFVTDTPYVGRNGYSLRLDGLDAGFNDRARERAIVMHGAPYVNAEITKSLGRLGRSHGCPAVREAVARELIDRVKGGSLVFAYYPDEEWLSSSKYLSCGR
jgi:hypothetical protein